MIVRVASLIVLVAVCAFDVLSLGSATSAPRRTGVLHPLLPAFLQSSRTAGSAMPVRGSALPSAVGSASPESSSPEFQTVALFAGQGAQKIGMAVKAAEESEAARRLFEEASDLLGFDLLEMCRVGTAEGSGGASINDTEVAQPALLVSSLALMKHWEENLAKEGREAMQRAARLRSSGMAALLGLSREEADLFCKAVLFAVSHSREAAASEGGSVCTVANALMKGNYVISGTEDALALAKDGKRLLEALSRERTNISEQDKATQERLLKELKLPLKVIPLKVSGGFHSELMAPAAEELKSALRDVKISPPKIPVISNVDCKAHFDPQEIKDILVKQLTSPVQWEACLEEFSARGVRDTYEFGPGRVLTNLVAKTLPKSVNTHVIE